MNLLVVAPNWLGDAVMALPALEDVRRGPAGAAMTVRSMTVAARPAIAPLFTLVPYVDDVVVLAAGGGPGARSARLRGRSFDAALLLPNSFHAALMAFRARIPERWGYRTDWRGCLLTRAVRCAPAGVHQIAYYQRLVRALGFASLPAAPRVEVTGAQRTAGASILRKAGWDGQSTLVAVAPGAAYGGAKRWPPERFVELIEDLAADAIVAVLIGSREDMGTGSEIVGRAHHARPLNLIGTTDLPSLAGVLAGCRTLVTNDSGAMHLAAALGVPVIALFGPTDERVTGPGGLISRKPTARGSGPDESEVGHTILSHAVWCRPCHLRECPLDHACMRGIAVDAVLAEARRVLT